MLDLLEKKSSLEVDREADGLLPSANLLLGYAIEGEGAGIENRENEAFAGISFSWPFPSSREKARHRIADIEKRKTVLANQNKYRQLYTDLKNLHIRIKREKKLIDIADEKIKLAESILEDESKNYSYGKVSLNDYITAVNTVDQNKFSKLMHSVRLKVLMIEWLRLTDQLVTAAANPFKKSK